MAKFLKLEMSGTVYIVDDDPSFSASLTNALRVVGYYVEAYPSVSEFLAEDLAEVAVIICDMRMPELTGLDLQAALKERKIDLPIIFVSGESTVNQAVEAMKMGATDFLTKPFEPMKLINLITKTLNEYEQRRSDIDALKSLSTRERIAFEFILEGFDNAKIAEKMDVKESTVREFKTNIYKKLNVGNLPELVHRFKSKQLK